MLRKTAIAVILGFLTLNTQAAEPAKYIQDCLDCHGPAGVSSHDSVPTIAGLSATYLEDTMFAYFDKARPAVSGPYLSGDTKRPKTDMVAISKALSEAQIKEVAGYFAKLPFVAAKQTFDPTLAGLGKQVHQTKCARCHDEAGSIAEDDAGILAGQWMPYLKQSFVEFRNKSRQGNKKMLVVMEQLSDKEVEALLHFYASNQR